MNKMLVVVDIESDGPVPGLYSMISFGAVVVDRHLDKTFMGKCSPISDRWDPEALSISGYSRNETMGFNNPNATMYDFNKWLNSFGYKPVFISDNPAFDWQFINYYFHKFVGSNPFGFSARRIGDIYAGLNLDMGASWKHLRQTKHTHNPLDDAKGNAEVLLAIADMGVKGIVD